MVLKIGLIGFITHYIKTSEFIVVILLSFSKLGKSVLVLNVRYFVCL